MIHFQPVIYSGLLATILGLGACGSMKPMMPNSSAIMTRLSGASEVPPTTSSASGTVEANLNKQTNELSWTVTYSGLSGPATGAHFHGPAIAGVNAGVVVPITGSLTSPIRGVASLTAAQTADLMAGKWYVNLHTAANPNGEIRGQLPARP
jgi:CHRD domain